uniref:Vesicle transport protein n=1 Tax=Trichuris muris TaxID=70415 RepID=A0A5S6R1S5_TRIMR
MRSLWKKFPFSGNDEEEDIISEVTSGSSLSWGTRIKLFALCFCFGIFFSILGSICVYLHNFTMFSVLFSFGSIMSISSTCFLMGPIKQLKKMADPNRWISSLIVVVMIVMTLFAAFYWKKGALCLLCVMLQYIAMTWYSLSYIPYARSTVRKCFEACIP